MVNKLGQHRLGRFSISRQYLEVIVGEILSDDDSVYRKFFGDMVILRAEHDFCTDCINYVAACRHFDEIEVGSVVPVYRANFLLQMEDDGKTLASIRFDGFVRVRDEGVCEPRDADFAN